MATRAQAVALAQTYIGCSRGDKRHRKLVDTFNSVRPHGEVGNYSCPWCAITWTALMIMLKMSQAEAAYSYNCGTLITYSKKIGTWVENDAYVPLPGDGIIYYWGDSGRGDCTSGASHVGMVQKVEKGYIYVIEGNKGSGYCGVRAIKVNSRYIRGFMVPKYEGSGKMQTSKLDVDGKWGTMTTLVSQQILGTTADGIVSQQDRSERVYCPNCSEDSWEWVRKPNGGSSLVKAIQKLVKVEKVDGYMGPTTIKALQKFLNIPVTGYIDTHTVRSWQLYMNKKIDLKNKKTEPAKTPAVNSEKKPETKPAATVKLQVPTAAEIKTASVWAVRHDICEWHKTMSKSKKNNKYKSFTDDKVTHLCPECNDLPARGEGWNCIGESIAGWRHGGLIPCRCNCEVINNSFGEKLIKMSKAEATAAVKSKLGITEIEVITNNGKSISPSKLKPGDLILYFDGAVYEHMATWVGNGLIADCSSANSPNIRYGKKNISYWSIKIAIRYTGGRTYLSLGANGTAVKKIQQIVGTTADGNFGTATLAAVKNWQKAHGLKDDGYIGSATIAAMKKVVK